MTDNVESDVKPEQTNKQTNKQNYSEPSNATDDRIYTFALPQNGKTAHYTACCIVLMVIYYEDIHACKKKTIYKPITLGVPQV